MNIATYMQVYTYTCMYMRTPKPYNIYSYMEYSLIRSIAEKSPNRNDTFFFKTSLTSLSFVCLHVCVFDGSHLFVTKQNGEFS